MHLVQVLIPVRDNAGVPFGTHLVEEVTLNLSKKFGGITAYTRAPAEGRWEAGGTTQHDDMLIVEVMVFEIDKPWWRSFREHLEHTFRQERIIVRAQAIELL
jgi:hypothetical protein